MSCGSVTDESKVDPDKVYTNYKAIYDEETWKVRYSASFYVNKSDGNVVTLNEKSYVGVGGMSMKKSKNNSNQIEYVLERPISRGDLDHAHELEFRNHVGGRFVNSFFFPQLPEHEVAAGYYVFKSTGLKINLKSRESSPTEGVNYSALIRTRYNNQEIISYASNASSKMIEFSRSDLLNAISGEGRLIICSQSRVAGEKLSTPKSGGVLNISSCSKAIRVMVTN